MRSIFVNLPVQDVTAAREFWAGLGFTFNETYSDDSCACLVVEQNICVMLLAEARFRDFIVTEVADAWSTKEVLLCLSCDSRQEVDDLLARALAHGGKPWKDVMDQGPMYGASFQDPDGHVWELMSMDTP